VDDTHLKGNYGGVLLPVVALDENNELLSITHVVGWLRNNNNMVFLLLSLKACFARDAWWSMDHNCRQIKGIITKYLLIFNPQYLISTSNWSFMTLFIRCRSSLRWKLAKSKEKVLSYTSMCKFQERLPWGVDACVILESVQCILRFHFQEKNHTMIEKRCRNGCSSVVPWLGSPKKNGLGTSLI